MSRRRQRHRRRLGRNSASMLKMTSLMDIFTTLLLFLLKSFVTDGQGATVMPGIELPPSATHGRAWDAPVIAVTKDHITCEDTVVPAAEALKGENLEIARLRATLTVLHSAGASQPGFTPRVVVQGDRKIEFKLLERVIYTSQRAGFTEVSLAVLHDETALLRDGASP